MGSVEPYLYDRSGEQALKGLPSRARCAGLRSGKQLGAATARSLP